MRFVGLVACIAASAFSYAASTGAAGKIDRLIEVSGIAYAARQLPPSIASGFDDPQAGLGDDVRAALREAAILSFRPDPIIEKTRKALTAALNARQLDDSLAWFDSPLGRRITDLENSASEPASNDRIIAYAKMLKEKPAAKHRAELIAKINEATQSGEINAMIWENTYLASALGINAAQPEENRMPAEAVRRRVKSTAPELRKESDENLTLTMLYTYQSLTDKELEAYLKFLKSSGGAAYSKASATGMREAMLEQMARFMQAIPKAIANQKGRVST
jgi:hypothetical protein